MERALDIVRRNAHWFESNMGTRRGRSAGNLSDRHLRCPMARDTVNEAVRINLGSVIVDADLHVPDRAAGLVIFAHGSGSSRFSRRNRAVAGVLEDAGFATLLLDLLTRDEESVDERTREYSFGIDLLGQRVVGATDWAQARPDLQQLPIAFFGASTGAAAALIAAAARAEVGGDDEAVIEMNRETMRRMRAPVELEIVPGATHLFEESGALEHVATLAVEWCRRYLIKDAA